MTHYEQCQRAVRLLLNQLLRKRGYKRPNEYKAVTALEAYVEAPAFHPQWRRELIEDAYEVHHLPSPYDVEAWEERRAKL